MERATPYKKPTVEKRTLAPAVPKRVATASPSVAQSLQQRLGNRATHQLVQRSRKPATQPPTSVTANEATTIQLGSIPSPLRISRPTDPAEREAEQVARKIVTMPESSTQQAATSNQSPIKKTVGGGHGATSASAQGSARTSSGPTPVTVPSKTGISGGSPLPTPVRRFMEPRFGANFGNVRIHTNQAAAKQSAQISAHAFTVGEHIHFGQDKFEPHSSRGKELIAHELTHTIQQGAVANRDTVHRSFLPVVSERTEIQAQRDLFSLPNPRDFFAEKAAIIPGFSMIALILGVNPINGRAVDRSAANLLRAAIDLMPGGALIRQALDSYGVFQRAGSFVEAQFATLRGLGASIRDAIAQFLSGFSVGDLLDWNGLWERAKALVTGPAQQVKQFVVGLVDGIVTLVKDAILRPLGAFAQTTRGYPLLRTVLGKDPITDEPVPANAENLVGGFLKFINEEETWNKMQQAGAVPRIFAWFQGALASVIGMVSALPGQFLNVFNSLKIDDILNIPGIFLKLASVFGSFATQFINWGAKAVWTLLEIIFDVVSPGALEYVKRTGAALKTIIRNPLPFVGQLIRAAKLGFTNFAGNFLTHLKAGLFDWLTGALPGIYIPQAFSLSEIAKFAFSVLGLSWANIRLKLVKAVGEPAVKTLETGFDLVVTLVREGPIAAWEKIKEQLSNLKDTVIGGITDFIVDMVVKKAIPKLIAMFIPGAGFISAILSIYDTVMVFVDKISQIISVVKGFVDSIVAIAAGNVGAAAQRVEQSLATGLSLAINFFAGFAGLGKVADKVMGIFAKLRAPIDKALDWLVGWIAKAAKKFVGAVKSGAKKVLNWFKKKVRVTGGNESHTLGFEGSAKNPRLVMRSEETKPTGFLARKAKDEKIKESESKGPISTSDRKEKAIDKILQSLKSIDETESESTSKKENAKANALATDLDGQLQELGKHIGKTLEDWNVLNDGKVHLHLARAKFTTEHKRKIAERHNKQSDLRKNKDGERINVKKTLARRHIVSSHNMAKHYEQTLNGKKVSECVHLIEKRGAISDARVSVSKLTVQGVIDAVVVRYQRFFGYVKNLFIGDSKENSRIQEHLDNGKPGMSTAELTAHVSHVTRAWALDQKFKPTPVIEAKDVEES